MSEERKPDGRKKEGEKPKGGGRPQRGPPLSPAQQRRRFAEERISNWFGGWKDVFKLDSVKETESVLKIKQFIKDHIIDECPEEYDDIF